MNSPALGAEVTVTTTYLHLPSPGYFRPAISTDPAATVLVAGALTPAFYRFLYAEVGRFYQWVDRQHWSDDMLEAHLRRPSVTVLVLYWRGVPAGFIELDREAAEPGTEIAYFGVMPPFQGRGLGKHLLTVGVQQAYANGAQRIWLHTCSLDGPYAMANYRARGFVPYRTTTHQQIRRHL